MTFLMFVLLEPNQTSNISKLQIIRLLGRFFVFGQSLVYERCILLYSKLAGEFTDSGFLPKFMHQRE